MFSDWQCPFLYESSPRLTQEIVGGNSLFAFNSQTLISEKTQSFCVAANAGEMVSRKKTIFLTDWTGLYRERQDFVQLLRDLLFHGFQIYTKSAVLEEDQQTYRKVTYDNLYECITQIKAPDLVELEVRRFCESENLSLDEVYLADYFGVERLFLRGGFVVFQETNYSFLNLPFFLSLPLAEQAQLSRECLQKSHIVLKGTVKKILNEEMLQQIESWPILGFYLLSGADLLVQCLFVGQNRTLEAVDLISIHPETAKKLLPKLESSASQILHLKIREVDIPSDQWPCFYQLKSLRFIPKLKQNDQKTFIPDGLQELFVEASLVGEGIDTRRLWALRSFYCHEISLSNLEKLSEEAPFLETLVIQSIQENRPNACALRFPELRRFQANEISPKHLKNLSAPRLERLDVLSVQGDDADHFPHDFKNLSWLFVRNISVVNLVQFLNVASNVELLKVSVVHGEWSLAYSLLLSNLRFLMTNDVPTEVFAHLLCAAPHLEKFQMVGERMDEWPTTLSPRLQQLGEFECQFISPEKLKKLSMCAPNLKRLQIVAADQKWPKGMFSFEKLQDFECYSIDSINLDQILDAAALEFLIIQYRITGALNSLLEEKVKRTKHYFFALPQSDERYLASSSQLEATAIHSNNTLNSVNAFEPKKHSQIYFEKRDVFFFQNLYSPFLRLRFYTVVIEKKDVFFKSCSSVWRDLHVLKKPSLSNGLYIEEQIPLRGGYWTILPTNSVGDELVRVVCKNDDGDEVSYRLQYDKTFHLYRIQSHEDVQCEFTLRRRENALLVEAGIEKRKAQSDDLSSFIRIFNEASSYQAFVDTVKKKNFSDKVSLIKELMAYITYLPNDKPIRKEQTSFNTLKSVVRDGGACRHRIWLFCAIAYALKVDCRYVSNKRHAFAEWRLSSRHSYQTCSLGGAGRGISEVLIQENSIFKPKSDSGKRSSSIENDTKFRKDHFRR
ncbi:MAG: hypothetical protein ABIH77_03135 [Pseudomonadota bacterium]